MEVLVCLARHGGSVVSKDKLIAEVWADTPFVGDDALVRCISELRRVFSDDPRAPRVIETIPKRGYRLLERVDKTATASSYSRKLQFRFGIALLGVSATVGASVLLYHLLIPRLPFHKMEIIKLTSSGKVTIATISPDGNYVAYATTENSGLIETTVPGRESLWVRQVATGSDVQIVPPIDLHYGGLMFGRDGRFLYVTQSESWDRHHNIVYKMPALGGTKKRLVEDVAVGWWYFGNPVALSPDGKSVAFLRDSTAMKVTQLMIANEDGSEEKQLAVRKWPNGFEGAVAWSPDGKVIAAATEDTEAGVKYASLIEVSVQGENERLLTKKRWAWVVDLAWASDGRGLFANTQQQPAGPVQVEYVSHANGEVRRITSDPIRYHGISATADSRVLATMQFEFSVDAWVGPVSKLDSAWPITSDGRRGDPTWSPDGRIVNWSYDDGNIWLVGSDGSNPMQLTSNSGFNADPRVSRDARYIAFWSNRSGSGQIWRMDTNGDNQKQLTYNGVEGSIGNYSPDGRWLLYSKAGAEQGVWKVSAEGGDPVRITEAEADYSAFSPDGNLIAYSYHDTSEYPLERFASPLRGIAIIPSAGGIPKKTFQILNLETFRWSADGRSLIYTKNEGGVYNFWNQPIAGGRPKQISHFNTHVIDSFDFSRDGKWLVMGRGTVRQDVALIRDLR